MTSISLGMPSAPPPVLAPRRQTRQIQVGKVGVGSDHPISVQSMTTTLTSDVNATLQQIAELTASGCDIVRVACPSQDDADALPAIAQKAQIPVIADIHFQPKYVYAAIEAGCAAVRVNPGNIRAFDDQVKQIAKEAADHGTSIRIGVNAGSLDKRLLEKYGKATPEALVESAKWEASLFEEHGFRDFKISVKHNDPVVMVRAYEMLAAEGDWPLHLGVTEAGPAFQGTIKSATAFGALAVLCVTEITSWGVLYYAFPVLAPSISADTGWSVSAVTGAFSAGLGVSAPAGIVVGRLLDRWGPRWVMTAGSLLGVPDGPVVCEAAVTAMAANVCGVLGADVSVAVTGVAGPDPQEGEEPGTVWMATCVDGVVDVVRTRWPFDRTRIRQFTVITVLDALRLLVEAEEAPVAA